jgi:hypothetical protein
MKSSIFIFNLAVLMSITCFGEPVPLIQGIDMQGWRGDIGTWVNTGDAKISTEDSKYLAPQPGSGVLLNGPIGKTRNIHTKVDHADVQLHVEFMVPKGSNSGVYLMGRYEIQVYDSFGKKKVDFSDCGGIYQRYDEEKQKGSDGRAPDINASKAPGEWQSFDITFRAPRFNARGKKLENAKFVKVLHNDKIVHENIEVTGPTRSSSFKGEKELGPLMLQGDHGPVAYRNIQLTHLHLDK